ncbi:DUF5132 domain-containing protein [Alkalinema pantanalense CENA528]|uniref:DUF5132 domain-containing protein n=1 Tax=Alkalinema pantanalense TaxID=1620705 RepID=UPI003D6E1E06
MWHSISPSSVGLRARVSELAAHPSTKVIAVGVATVALTPVILPLVKPLLKTTIKTSLTVLENTKALLAETGELLADIAAEAKAEALAESEKRMTFQPSVSKEPLPQQPVLTQSE